MEVKLAGFIEPIGDPSDKKSTSSQDEFSEVFSALLLNLVPNLNNQQLTGNAMSQDNKEGTSVSLDNINFVPIDKENLNSLEGLMKYDPNLSAFINDFKALVSKENSGKLIPNNLELDGLISELGETDKTEDNAKIIKKLANIIGMLENKTSNEKTMIDKLNNTFNLGKEILMKTNIELPINTGQTIESEINLEPSNNQGLDIKNLALDNKDTSPTSIIDNQTKNNSQIGFSPLPKVEVGKNPLELSRLITKPEDLLDIAVEKFKSLRLPDRTELNVKLRPEELGEITVKLVLEKGQVNGNIIAENKDVVNMLKAQIDGLKQDLKNNNVNLTSLNVNVSSDNLFNNGREGKEFSQNNHSNSRKYEQFEDLTLAQEEEGFTIMA